MVLGMSLATFTALHVVISVIAIATGLVVAAGMLAGNRLPGWTAVFLVTTVLTSVTGFLFPFTQVLPSHIVGAISLVVLALALLALCGKELAGSWRGVYVIASILALYLNVFVLVVQAFLKIPALNRLGRPGPSRRSRSRSSWCWPSSSGWASGPCGGSIRGRCGSPSPRPAR